MNEAWMLNIQHGLSDMFRLNEDKRIDEDMILEVNLAKSRGDIRLKPKEWELVLQIDGIRRVGEIIDRLNMEKEEIVAVLSNLYQKNLIKVKIHADKVNVETEFFTKLEKILTEYLGPVAPFVIDEMLVELNEERLEFNREKLPLLAEMISRTIEDDVKRINYQSVILEQLRAR